MWKSEWESGPLKQMFVCSLSGSSQRTPERQTSIFSNQKLNYRLSSQTWTRTLWTFLPFQTCRWKPGNGSVKVKPFAQMVMFFYCWGSHLVIYQDTHWFLNLLCLGPVTASQWVFSVARMTQLLCKQRQTHSDVMPRTTACVTFVHHGLFLPILACVNMWCVFYQTYL